MWQITLMARARERVWQRGKCCRRTCCLIHLAGSCWWKAHLSHKALAPRTLASVSLSVSIPCFFFFLQSSRLRFFCLFLCLHISVPGILWVLSDVQSIREGGSSHTLKTATSWNIHSFSVEHYVCVVSHECVCVCVCECMARFLFLLLWIAAPFYLHKWRANGYFSIL